MEPEGPPPTNRARLDWVWVGLVALALLGTFAGERDLFDADEGRYAGVALAMAESGDWVVPRLDDMPFLDKPPLVYWIQAALLEVLPASPLVARAPTLLAGAIWVVLLFLLTLRWTGSRGRAWTVAALTVTSGAAVIGSRVGPQMDMPLTACVTGALFAAYAGIERVVRGERHPALASIGLGVAIGLGLLTKGPLVVAIPFVVAISWILAGVRAGAVLRVTFSPLAWGVALLVATPWYVAIESAEPGWIGHFIGYEHFGRFSKGDHRGFAPFWFYVPVALIYLLPWVHLAWGTGPASAGAGRRLLIPVLDSPWSPLPWGRALTRALPLGKDGRPVNAGRLAFGWFIAAFLLYSVSTRKLLNYLLPAAGPLMILAGTHLYVAAESARARAARLPWIIGLATIVAAAAIAIGIWFPLETGRLPTAEEAPRFQPLAGWVALAGTSLLLGALLASRARSRRATVVLLVGAATSFWWLLDLGFARTDIGSSRELAAVLDREAGPDDRVVAFKRYPQGLAWYSDLPVWIAGGGPSSAPEQPIVFVQREIVEPYASRHWRAQPRDAAGTPVWDGRGGLLTDMELEAIWHGESRVLLICRFAEITRFGGRIVSGPHAGAGRTDLYVVTNRR